MKTLITIKKHTFEKSTVGKLLTSVEHLISFLLIGVSLVFIVSYFGDTPFLELSTDKTILMILGIMGSFYLIVMSVVGTNSMLFWRFFPLSKKWKIKIKESTLKEIEELEKKSKERIEKLQKEIEKPCPHMLNVEKLRKAISGM